MYNPFELTIVNLLLGVVKMFNFLNNLDNDLRQALLIQLRNLWTHTSTAIEGNTLTLGEPAFVLEEGLNIAGKPLKDHQEVVGHARAIDLIYDSIKEGGELTETDLFALHKAVQTEVIVDVYKPVGSWKKEPNATVGVVDEKQVIFEYASPDDVAALMADWFDLNRELICSIKPGDDEQALYAYVRLHIGFVRIHPYLWRERPSGQAGRQCPGPHGRPAAENNKPERDNRPTSFAPEP